MVFVFTIRSNKLKSPHRQSLLSFSIISSFIFDEYRFCELQHWCRFRLPCISSKSPPCIAPGKVSRHLRGKWFRRRNNESHLSQNRYIQNTFAATTSLSTYYGEMRVAVKSVIEKFVNTDVERPSTSPRASPVIIIHKKDGSWRMCVDYLRLNSVTTFDCFAAQLKRGTWRVGKSNCYY